MIPLYVILEQQIPTNIYILLVKNIYILLMILLTILLLPHGLKNRKKKIKIILIVSLLIIIACISLPKERWYCNKNFPNRRCSYCKCLGFPTKTKSGYPDLCVGWVYGCENQY